MSDTRDAAYRELLDTASAAHPGLDEQAALHAFLAEGSEEAHDLHDAWLNEPRAEAPAQAETWREIEHLAARLQERQPAGSPVLSEARAIARALDTEEGRELFERHQDAFRRDSPTYQAGYR